MPTNHFGSVWPDNIITESLRECYNSLNNVAECVANVTGTGTHLAPSNPLYKCSTCTKIIVEDYLEDGDFTHNGLSFMRWPLSMVINLNAYTDGQCILHTCNMPIGSRIKVCWDCFCTIYAAYYTNTGENLETFETIIQTNYTHDCSFIICSLEHAPTPSHSTVSREVDEPCEAGDMVGLEVNGGRPCCRYCGAADNDVTCYDNMWGDAVELCARCERNGYHLIHEYSYEPELTFYETAKDKRTELYYGIELEVEVLPEFRIPDIIKRLPDFIYVKSDSSILRGFEIVTHPATYNWLLDHTEDWQNILDIRNYGCRSYNTQTCGMHIHMSKAAFGRHHLYKYLYFIYNPVNKVAITQISQRKDNLLARWSGFNNDMRTIKDKAFSRAEVGDRHTAVGLGRLNTVELRIFRGTLRPVSFWKNIEFAHALYNFTRDNGLSNMIWIKFIEYVRIHKRSYPNLSNFLFCEQIETILNY